MSVAYVGSGRVRQRRSLAVGVGCACSALVHAVALASLSGAGPVTVAVAVEAVAITLVAMPDPAPAPEVTVGPPWPGLAPRASAKGPRARALAALAADPPGEHELLDERLDTEEPWGTPPGPRPIEAAMVEEAPSSEPLAEEVRPVRVYDPFPRLPASDVDVTVRVCVSDQGAVRDASFDGAVTDRSRAALRDAILRWRYRPMKVKGVQTAFCHRMRITYGTH